MEESKPFMIQEKDLSIILQSIIVDNNGLPICDHCFDQDPPASYHANYCNKCSQNLGRFWKKGTVLLQERLAIAQIPHFSERLNYTYKDLEVAFSPSPENTPYSLIKQRNEKHYYRSKKTFQRNFDKGLHEISAWKAFDSNKSKIADNLHQIISDFVQDIKLFIEKNIDIVGWNNVEMFFQISKNGSEVKMAVQCIFIEFK